MEKSIAKEKERAEREGILTDRQQEGRNSLPKARSSTISLSSLPAPPLAGSSLSDVDLPLIEEAEGLYFPSSPSPDPSPRVPARDDTEETSLDPTASDHSSSSSEEDNEHDLDPSQNPADDAPAVADGEGSGSGETTQDQRREPKYSDSEDATVDVVEESETANAGEEEDEVHADQDAPLRHGHDEERTEDSGEDESETASGQIVPQVNTESELKDPNSYSDAKPFHEDSVVTINVIAASDPRIVLSKKSSDTTQHFPRDFVSAEEDATTDEQQGGVHASEMSGISSPVYQQLSIPWPTSSSPRESFFVFNEKARILTDLVQWMPKLTKPPSYFILSKSSARRTVSSFPSLCWS